MNNDPPTELEKSSLLQLIEERQTKRQDERFNPYKKKKDKKSKNKHKKKNKFGGGQGGDDYFKAGKKNAKGGSDKQQLKK